MYLTDKHWMRIEPVILQSIPKKNSRGRKPRDPREVLNGTLMAALYRPKKGRCGRSDRIMAIADAAGTPVAACLESAAQHEVKLDETALDSLFIARQPEKLLGDKAYESKNSMILLLKKARC